MRKVIVAMNSTLDGFSAGPNGELDWATVDEAAANGVNDLLGHTDFIVYGRVTYEMMVQYWPTAPVEGDIFTERMNTIPKLVVSQTLESAPWGEWNNATVLKGDVAETIRTLKQEEGNDVVIMGGGTLVASFTQLGLIDEYHFMVNPVVIGSGIPFFADMTNALRLTLLETKPYPSGVVSMKYAVVRD